MAQTLGQIAQAIRADLHGDPSCIITGVAPISGAGDGQLTFLANRRYARLLETTRAAAVILTAADLESCPVPALVAADPYVAYVKAVGLLHPEPGFIPGIHPRAAVSASASVDPRAYVGANAVIGEHSRVAAGVFIGPGCAIGEDVTVGADSKLVANVTLCRAVTVGERVILHPGSIIGADGFGLVNDGGTWLKIPQLGRVVLGNDVEIGANTTIDRGALEDTVIEEGVKIDNLVQIGHNTRVGAHTAIAGGAVIAGSVHIGRRCMIGGATAISGHIEIADDVIITGMSGVPNSIRESGTYSGGVPTLDNHTWRRNVARMKHLDELARKVQRLEAALEEQRHPRTDIGTKSK
ncbi:MAG: UDP-3-O-(3-hydroxymyristoyl)glucosamine N-acyltransferase [Gammaproteobacteria bacterium]|nr:UDP-3-O-(3-hydroxymyristoyl)glucosamine N-acyltransferase [Gammaproteobacteria bacterium]